MEGEKPLEPLTGSNCMLLMNGELCAANDVKTAPPEALLIYEVIRVMAGVPLFLEAHIQRLNRSLALAGVNEALSSTVLTESIRTLTESCGISDQNLRLNAWKEGTGLCWTALFVESHYPSPETYHLGVSTGLLQMERSNPNAKVWQAELKAAVSLQCEQRDLFEMILVDSKGFISEGSRSNLFFTQGNTLITAPDEAVLEGITRLQLLEIITARQIPLIKRDISVAELDTFDGAFITGTSIQLLPVRQIDAWERRSSEQPLIQYLMAQFRQAVTSYQQAHSASRHPQEENIWNE